MLGQIVKIYKLMLLLLIVFSCSAHALGRKEIMSEFKGLEKELKLLAAEQYAHESAEADKVSENPGYVPNNLVPDVKAGIVDVIGRIITFRESAISNPVDTTNCKVALTKYLNSSLPTLKLAYSEYAENKSTLFVGVQNVVMANSVDGAAFISGPAFECAR